MTTGGNGSLELWKYSYPTQRSIQACNRSIVHAIMIIVCMSSATRAAPYRARTTDARGVAGPRRPREGRARLGDSAAEEDLLNAAEYAHATHHTCSFLQTQSYSILRHARALTVASFDWNADKEGLAVMGVLDQTVRVIVTTKLNLV